MRSGGTPMLLRFGVANHLSIKEPQALSLAASSLKDVEGGLISSGAAPEGRILPAAVIYGANASGKTNIVAAVSFMRSAVLFSHARGKPGGGVPRAAFALDPACATAPSTFTADFVVEGVRYHYGFEASDDEFTTEWLYAFPSGRRQTLFERERQRFTFGRALKGRNRVIADLTRPNSLFISAAAQNDHEDLSKIGAWFRSLYGYNEIDVPEELVSSRLAKGEVDARVITLLSRIGTGVIGYRRLERQVSEQLKEFQKDLSSAIHKITTAIEFNWEKDDKVNIIELAHRGNNDEPVYFELKRESAGTRRLVILLGLVFQALDEGAPIVIDELDASLHTQACEAVLALFLSPDTNPRGAQLIATTHDTNLLRSRMLRRDQIWFTEKDDCGATHLYPLTDIRTRKGDNIEKGYLQGRFGAIPFSGSISDLISAA
jgi:uncharacterized protein